MLRLRVEVPEDRASTAVATLRAALKTIASGPAVATATPAIAALTANPGCDPLRMGGHPPLGSYRLLHHAPVRGGLAGEYGSHFFLFEPQAGPALEAEAFGRLGLLAYGGPAGRDKRMRRTQGGLRLTNSMLEAALARVRAGDEMVLEIAVLAAPAWWQFWKAQPKTFPLSDTALTPFPPPGDEASQLEALLGLAPRRAQRRETPEEDRDRDRDRDRSDDTRSERGERETFRGRGGEMAGGGASGSWDAPAAGRGPGVDQAGRIAAGAAAAAVAAGLLSASSARDDAAGHAAAESSSGDDTAGSSASDSGGGGDTDSSSGTTY